MFNYAVKQLPLADVSADTFFMGIKADSFNGDVSFTATLRALLYGRLRDDESVTVKLDVKDRKDVNPVIGHSAGLPHAIEYSPQRGVIHIRVIKGVSDSVANMFLRSDAYETAKFSKAEDVSMYLSGGGCKAYVYISESMRQVLVLMNNLNMKCWHKIQSAIPKLLPWYFGNPLTEIERDLLRSLIQTNEGEYIRLIKEYAGGFNYREDRLRRLLKDYCATFEQKRMDVLVSEREKNRTKFNSLQAELERCVAREQALVAEIAGLEMAVRQGSEIGMADYFIRNKCLHLVGVDAEKHTMTYVVTAHIEYFDQRMFDKCYNNASSFFYDTWRGSDEELSAYKALLQASFGDEVCVRIRTCAAFQLTFPNNLNEMTTCTHLEEYDEWLLHPHIIGASCLGSNRQRINSLMFEKRFIEAVEQTVAATRNINFADTGICRSLAESLARSSQRFLELPTGEVVTPAGAIAWLRKEGKI